MNILLIRPKPHQNSIGLMSLMICEPLELEYLSSYLEHKGHQVDIVDMFLETMTIPQIIKHFNPDIVGLTSYITHVNVIKDYAKLIKKSKQNCIVVAGGVHAEVIPADFESPYIDYIVNANGMKSFGELIEQLEINAEIKVEGLWNKCVVAPIDKTFNYPLPDRKKTKKYRSHYDYLFHVPCALLKTSFGCPYNCEFCFCVQITQHNYFERNLIDVIEEIESIEEKNIFIVDDDFLLNPQRVLEFCQLLSEHNIQKKFILFGRADFIANYEKVIETFSKLGLVAVFVGIESFKQSELQLFNKRSSIDINEKAIAILHKYNVECYAGIVVMPDWKKEDFKGLQQWMLKHDVILANIQPLTPLPGTPIFQQYKSNLLIPRDKHECWDLAHIVIKPKYLSVREFYVNILKVYFKTSASFRAIAFIYRKYGLKVALKMIKGGTYITWQYIKKIMEG